MVFFTSLFWFGRNLRLLLAPFWLYLPFAFDFYLCAWFLYIGSLTAFGELLLVFSLCLWFKLTCLVSVHWKS